MPAETSSSPKLRLGFAAVAVAVLTWGWSNVVIKALSTTGLVASVYRLWLAIPLLWMIPVMVPSVRRQFTRDWARAALGGGVLFAVHQILFFTSLKMTSVVNVAIIGALQPALVLVVAGRLFGEAVTTRALAYSLVAVAGTGLVVAGSAGAPHWSPMGDLIATVNLFAFTAYFLASKRFRSAVGATAYVVGMTTVAGAVVLAVALLTGQDLSSPRGYDWPLLAFLAIFPGTLGHLLTNWAHPHVPALLMSVMLLAVPVISAGGAAALLGETLNGVHIIGGAIVMAAIGVIVFTSSGRAARRAGRERGRNRRALRAAHRRRSHMAYGLSLMVGKSGSGYKLYAISARSRRAAALLAEREADLFRRRSREDLRIAQAFA